MPRPRLENIYVRADLMVGPLFKLQGANSVQMDGIEINNALLGPRVLYDDGGGSYNIGTLRVEVGTYDTSVAMFYLPNAATRIGFIDLETLTVTGGGVNPYIFSDIAGSSTGNLQIGEFKFAGSTISGGNLYVFGGDNTSGYYEIDRLVGSLPTNCLLTDLTGTAAAERAKVGNWAEPRFSADKGDADYTITIGDPTIVYYNSPLSVNRTVTLPATTGTNAFNGLTYRVVRTASATGASTLTVGSKALALGQSVDVTYRRTAWIETNLSTL